MFSFKGDPNSQANFLRREGIVEQPWAINTLTVLNTYYMAIAIYGGLVGNLLSFLTFRKSCLRAKASSYYMSALAASDFGFLFVISFEWLSAMGLKMTAFPGVCQITVFMTESFATLSVWLTVSFTAERYLAICYPLWRQIHMSTRRRARSVVSTLMLLSFILNSHSMLDVTAKPVSKSQPYICEAVLEKFLYFMNITDSILTFCLPALVISFMNLMIAKAIFVSHTLWKHQGAALNPRESTDSTARPPIEALGALVPSPVLVKQPVKNPVQVSITRTLLLVSSVFLILNSPFHLSRIYLHLYIDKLQDRRPVIIMQRYFMILYYTHFSINFILYNVSSSMFRSDLRDCLRSMWIGVKRRFSIMPRISKIYGSSTVVSVQVGHCDHSITIV